MQNSENREYRILNLQVLNNDVDEIKNLLDTSGFSFKYLFSNTEENFKQSIKEFHPNIILYSLHQSEFTSLKALEIYKEMNLEIPFILITGNVSEEYAVEMMKKGIDDYLLKVNLHALPKAIEDSYNKREKEMLRKQAEIKLTQNESLLSKAQEIGHIGSWEFNIKTKKEIWSNEIYRILGISNEEVEPSQELFLSTVHSEDIDFVRKNIEKARINLSSSSFSCRIILEDKEIRHVYYESKYEFSEDGKASFNNGILHDITEKVLRDEKVKFDKNNLSALINNTNDLMWSVDLDYNLITSNLAFDNMIKLLSGEMISKGSTVFSKGFDDEQINRFKGYYDKAFLGEIFTETEVNNSFWSEISFYPIYNEDKVIGTACFSRDITERKIAEKKIEESKKRFQALIEKSADMKTLSNMKGEFIYGSPSITKVLGYSNDQFLNKSATNFIHPDDLPDLLKKSESIMKVPGKSFIWQYRLLHKNGSWVWCEGTLTNMIHEPALKAFIANFHDISERKKTELEILKKNEQLRYQASHLQHIREYERTKMSREIHDELGQQLTALKMDIDWVLHKQENQKKSVIVKLKEMLKMNDDIMTTIRRISFDLRPAIIDDLGLIAALEWKCNNFEKKTGISCQFISNIKERKFESNFSINTFRILQETFTNISRHAEAKSVVVNVNQNKTELFIEIVDDGKGINNENINNGKTLGILGMKERAALLGGSLVIEGTKNIGTITKLKLPFKNEYTYS